MAFLMSSSAPAIFALRKLDEAHGTGSLRTSQIVNGSRRHYTSSFPLFPRGDCRSDGRDLASFLMFFSFFTLWAFLTVDCNKVRYLDMPLNDDGDACGGTSDNTQVHHRMVPIQTMKVLVLHVSFMIWPCSVLTWVRLLTILLVLLRVFCTPHLAPFAFFIIHHNFSVSLPL